mmetsp:Transcript_12359/g.18544  ORF Transcript_12359/g.18544 Transcript_12359/m.18544 type:complete len:304 (-) Transcript_12359:2590-3501(-)
MVQASRLDPATVRDLAEQGVGNRIEGDEESVTVSNEAWEIVKGREDEVMLVAQSLAFFALGTAPKGSICEKVTKDRSVAIHKLLLAAYADEVTGPEAFRSGDLIDVKTMNTMLNDEDCQWLCCESVKDSELLGVACYSINNNTAMLRFLGVQQRLRGLCLGQRILDKLVKQVSTHGAERLVLCIPSTRKSMQAWAERRYFKLVDTVPFPVANLSFTITKLDASLHVFVRDLLPVAPLKGDHGKKLKNDSKKATYTTANKKLSFSSSSSQSIETSCCNNDDSRIVVRPQENPPSSSILNYDAMD